MNGYPLDKQVAIAGGTLIEAGGIPMARDFGDPDAEYENTLHAVGIQDARDRGLIEITGPDRAAWLHNLVTNAVKTLQPGEGNYAFVLNAKGRILFDCNIIVLPDRIWVDVDRRYLLKATAHFERYHITEDIQLTDRSDAFCRIALLGPQAPDIAEALGATQARNMAAFGSTTVPLRGKQRLMVRDDSMGVAGLQLYIEAADADACWERLIEIGGATIKPVGQNALDTLRIEAGIPRYGRDIDEETLPAETGQLERAVSFVKGCYLGQEIVERMRSRGGLARKLAGIQLADGAEVSPSDILKSDQTEVGRVTSVCESPAVGSRIGLGYVKTAHGKPGTQLLVHPAGPTQAGDPVQATIVALPFRPFSS